MSGAGGLHIWRVDGEAVIDCVDAGSPAESLGLRAKDVVIEVDGQPAADVPLSRLRGMLRNTAHAVGLTIRRGDLTRAVELAPREFREQPSPRTTRIGD